MFYVPNATLNPCGFYSSFKLAWRLQKTRVVVQLVNSFLFSSELFYSKISNSSLIGFNQQSSFCVCDCFLSRFLLLLPFLFLFKARKDFCKRTERDVASVTKEIQNQADTSVSFFFSLP